MSVKLFRNTLKALLVAVGSVTALLFILSYVSYKSPDPDKFLSLFAYAALLIGAVLCGAVSSRINKKDGLICGALTGALYSLLLLMGSAICGMGDSFNPLLTLVVCAVSVLISSVFGILFVPKDSSMKKRRREMLAKVDKHFAASK